MPSPLNIWSNRALPPDLAADFERQLAPHRVVWAADLAASNLSSAASDPQLVEHCDIAFGQPTVEDLLAARKLRLVCLSSAGYTRYDRDDLRAHCRERKIAFCNASGVYADPCAQHVLAMMLGLARQLPQSLDNQRRDHGWPYLPLREHSHLLNSQTKILIVGYGSIARRLVELLAPFNPSIIAFRRKPSGDENCNTLAVSDLDQHLGTADDVVNILPASKETTLFFNADRLGRIKRGGYFFNIGRGDTVDQTELVAALTSGQLGAAYLDVTTPEPLPPEHPLWTTPNCFITPHTAGGSVDEAQRQIAHFADNVRRFKRGEPLVDRLF